MKKIYYSFEHGQFTYKKKGNYNLNTEVDLVKVLNLLVEENGIKVNPRLIVKD